MQKRNRKRIVLLSPCWRGCSPKAHGLSNGLIINILITSFIVSTKHFKEAVWGRKGLLYSKFQHTLNYGGASSRREWWVVIITSPTRKQVAGYIGSELLFFILSNSEPQLGNNLTHIYGESFHLNQSHFDNPLHKCSEFASTVIKRLWVWLSVSPWYHWDTVG